MLRKRFQKILLDLLEKDIGKSTFRPIKNKVYSLANNGFYVILRYCGRPCFAQYRIIDIDNKDFITFWYQRHGNDFFVVEKIHIFEFMARLIRHIPDHQFKTIRYYGFYASHKHSLYHNACKLFPSFKLDFYKSLNSWRNLLVKSFNQDPLLCPKCHSTMIFEYGFS